MFGKLWKSKSVEIVSPLEGAAVSLSKVNDPVFSKEMLGKGIAIRPVTGHVVSPVNGIISQMFDTSHAVSLVSDEGVEILIHIGLDTVRLKGEHFTSLAKTGDSVKVGDGLIDFNIEAIKEAGYDVVTPVVVFNSDNYKQFHTQTGMDVKIGDEIIRLGG